MIPPAYGLDGIHSVTVTGDGTELAYWNRYVAVTQMGGLGTMTEPRLNLSVTNGSEDLVTSKLPALQAYQLSLPAPAAPAGSFDAAAAARGKRCSTAPGTCATCHSGALFTDANTRLHPAGDSMAEPESPSYAARSATKQYRTSPLKGVWQHAPYFHDGSAATLADVVAIYNTKRARPVHSADERPDRVPQVAVTQRRGRRAASGVESSGDCVEQRAEHAVLRAQDLQVGFEQVLAELQRHQVFGQRVADLRRALDRGGHAAAFDRLLRHHLAAKAGVSALAMLWPALPTRSCAPCRPDSAIEVIEFIVRTIVSARARYMCPRRAQFVTRGAALTRVCRFRRAISVA